MEESSGDDGESKFPHGRRLTCSGSSRINYQRIKMRCVPSIIAKGTYSHFTWHNYIPLPMHSFSIAPLTAGALPHTHNSCDTVDSPPDTLRSSHRHRHRRRLIKCDSAINSTFSRWLLFTSHNNIRAPATTHHCQVEWPTQQPNPVNTFSIMTCKTCWALQTFPSSCKTNTNNTDQE